MGLAAAAVTAASPIVLYQVIQPMSDVPAAAFWVLALAAATCGGEPAAVPPARGRVRRASAFSFAPTCCRSAFVIGVYLLARPGQPWRARGLATPRVYAAGCAVACVAVLLIQRHFYGSPFASGYGGLGEIFAAEHVAPNAARYLHLARAVADAARRAGAGGAVRAAAGLCAGVCLAFCAVTLAAYLPYLVFEDWSYVRFLLPAIPVLIVLMLGTLAAAGRRAAGARWEPAALALSPVGPGRAGGARRPRRGRSSSSRSLESVFARAGDVVAQRGCPATPS